MIKKYIDNVPKRMPFICVSEVKTPESSKTGFFSFLKYRKA